MIEFNKSVPETTYKMIIRDCCTYSFSLQIYDPMERIPAYKIFITTEQDEDTEKEGRQTKKET